MWKITRGTLILDREEQRLREEGAKTLQDAEAYYDRHYPYAFKSARKLVTEELFSRISEDAEVETQKCRLPFV